MDKSKEFKKPITGPPPTPQPATPFLSPDYVKRLRSINHGSNYPGYNLRPPGIGMAFSARDYPDEGFMYGAMCKALRDGCRETIRAEINGNVKELKAEIKGLKNTVVMAISISSTVLGIIFIVIELVIK